MVGKILIVDDVATNRIVLKVKLGAAFYQPLLAADGAGCLALAREAQPDLILLDLMLPDMSGIDVLQRLRADPLTRETPVLVFSSTTDPEARLAAFRAGADGFLSKPIDDQTLLARLRSLLRGRDGPSDVAVRGAVALGLAESTAAFDTPGLVALLSDRPDTAHRWRRDLTGLSTDRLIVMSPEEALADNRSTAVPDVFLIEADLGLPGGGLRLLSDLRSRSATRHAAICILRTADACHEDTAMALDLGANDVVPATVPAAELALRLHGLLARKRRADRLRASVNDSLRLSVLDPLTGLYNRRYVLPHLAAMAEQAMTSGAAFAVMVVDLDRFKAVNDRWGHAAGDAVLVEVARRLAANLRPQDLLGRIGGEEFLIGLSHNGLTPEGKAPTGLAEARAVAERLCRAVQERACPLPGGGGVTITVSIGLALRDPGRAFRPEPVAALVDRADRALMVAKAEGRNQVTIGRSAA